MDPDGDGYISKTYPLANPACNAQCPFSSDGYNVDEFEIPMFGIPQIGNGDVTNDNIGNSCGITDLIPDSKGHSVYAVHQTSNNQDNLIFRFRVGDNNPSVEAWSILLDTDGLFGANDPNATASNPGFEIDITFIKRNNAGVYVYNIDGIQSCPTPLLSYSINSNFQISIADLVTCGDPDYFYDFYVPFAALASAFNISSTTGLRFVAVVNVSATCAMSGNIADVSGLDNNDPLYSGCVPCAFKDLVDNQCPTPIADLCPTCGGFEKEKVGKPTIDLPVRAGQSIISGTADAGIFIIVEIYSNIGTATSPAWGTTPRETKSNYAVGAIWSIPLSQPLLPYDKIVAKAQKNATSVPCGSAGGNLASVEVTVVQPNTPPVAQSQTITVIEDIPKNIVLVGTDTEGDPLIYTIVTTPTQGVISGTAPTIIYTPPANYNGPDVFTFQVNDGIYSSVSPGTITINVTPVNDVPLAVSQNVTTAEDVSKAITLVATDPDIGNVLTYTIVSPPANGTLSGTGANVTYTPAANYNGSDSFTFKANDGSSDSNIATVSVTITPLGDSPIAFTPGSAVTTTEDVAKAITLVGIDPDGDAITYIIISGPAHGILSGTGSNLTYTPDANYNGSDSFTFKVNDGTSDSNITTVSITITPLADSPIALDQSIGTTEDVAKGITLTGTDPDADVLTFSIVSGPLHGTLSGTGANVTYTPSANYNGTDNFTFKINDGTTDSNSATITITITPTGDSPIAITPATAATTLEDVAKTILLVGSDPDGDAIAYSIVSLPSHGTLSGTGSNITYIPAANYNGPDNFTFKVNDGTTDSNIATVSIIVTPVNDAPFAISQSATYIFNTPKGIVLTGFDFDSDPLTFALLTSPLHGSLSGTAPTLTYTPDPGYTGSDNFTFKVNDGIIDSDIATLSLTLATGANIPPVANNQTINIPEDVSTSIILSATDANGDPLSYIIVTPPLHGILSGTGFILTFIPTTNYTGTDNFTFKVNDTFTDSNTATVTITITPVGDSPIANNMSITTAEDVAKTLALDGNDPDGESISYTLVSPPTRGTLSGTAPNITYLPNPNYVGFDSFTYKVNDGTTDSNIATVSITVTPVSDAPIANNQSSITSEDVAKAILLSGIDPDGNTVTYSIVSNPTNGTLSGTGASVIYAPSSNYNGSDSFTFNVNNGTTDSNIATVSITITPIADSPLAENQSVSLLANTVKNITLIGNDPDGDAITYNLVSPPTHGTVTGLPPNVTYTPNVDYFGSDSFTFKVNDGTSDSNIGTITLTVKSRPTAIDQRVTTTEDVAKSILLVGSDPEGDVLTYSIVSNPIHGSLSGTGATITYTPEADYNGSDSFTFKVSDDTADSNIGTVSITINPSGDEPLANNQSVTVIEDIAKSITLTASDADGDAITHSILSQPLHGTLNGTAPTVTYTPTLNYFGSDSFTFNVNDGTTDSNIGIVSINVDAVNDAPVITALPVLYTKEDSTLQVCLNVTDVEGDAITFANPTNTFGGGTMIRDVAPYDFCYIFTPIPDYNGESHWDLKVSDAGGLTGTTSVKIIITPVNDPPVATLDTITVLRKVPTNGNVLTNDYDIEGNAFTLTTTPVNNVLHGEVTMSTNGNFTYVSDKTFRGIDSLSYQVCDTGSPARCSIGKLVITVGDLPFKVYEGFTPNGDGQNEFLRIEGIDYYENCIIKIFDRYNNLVFVMEGYDNEGKVFRGIANKGLGNDVLPEGTYFYIVTLGEGSKPTNGFIVLKRN